MASIDPATLTAALADAMQISTVFSGEWPDPPAIVAASTGEGAGASIAIVASNDDTVDVKGQLARRGWRPVAIAFSPSPVYSAIEWART